MKTIIRKFTFTVFLSLLTQAGFSQTVYVTEQGKKFHKKNCGVAKEGKKGLQFEEAMKAGFLPCSVCKPVKNKAVSVKEKSKIEGN